MSVRKHGSLQDDEEVNAASWEAARGAVIGAATWGLGTGLLGAAAYFYSPVYRGLIIQFKVFLQMSGMALGGMIEADRRLRQFEVQMRRQKRLRRDAEVWRRYEAEYEAKGTPGVQAESTVKNATLDSENVSSLGK